MAHVINLASQDALSEIKTEVEKIRHIVKAIKFSIENRRIYEASFRSDGPSPSEPVLDVRTRWNSTYLMIRKALEVKEVGSGLDLFSHQPIIYRVSIKSHQKIESLSLTV